jgi:hypothetical protein
MDSDAPPDLGKAAVCQFYLRLLAHSGFRLFATGTNRVRVILQRWVEDVFELRLPRP